MRVIINQSIFLWLSGYWSDRSMETVMIGMAPLDCGSLTATAPATGP